MEALYVSTTRCAEIPRLMGIPIFETAPYLSQAYDFGHEDMDSVYRAFIRVFRELVPPPAGARKVVGVDGCKGGWAAVSLTGDRADVHIFPTVSDLFAAHADAELFIVDLPIGLPESPDDKRPEKASRKLLSGKASSIFGCPCRQAVYADLKDASAVNMAVLGKALSAQSVGLIPKFRELDEFLTAHADIRPRVLESHPELCFEALRAACRKASARRKGSKNGWIYSPLFLGARRGGMRACPQRPPRTTSLTRVHAVCHQYL